MTEVTASDEITSLQNPALNLLESGDSFWLASLRHILNYSEKTMSAVSIVCKVFEYELQKNMTFIVQQWEQK